LSRLIRLVYTLGMSFANQRVSAKSAAATLILSILLVSSTAIALDASNTPESGYVLCVNKKTKAVTYPASLNCASSETKLLIGGQRQSSSGSSSSVESLVSAILPKVQAATYAVTCNGTSVTATGVSLTMSADAARKGYKGALVTASYDLEDCLDTSVPVTQNGKNFGGYVWEIDEENNLAMIMTISTINSLRPVLKAPERGSFLMTYIRGSRGGTLPEGSIGTGILANINPDFDEEVANIWVGGNSRDLWAPIVDKNGDFVSIGSKKPGVFCRNLLKCSTDSDFLRWSR
jgi:hypothetical protein